MIEKYTEVLSQYELEILDVRRGRGAWLCETNQGLKLLREYKGTIKRLDFEDQVFTQLEEAWHPFVDRYVRNREGELLSSADDGTRWIVKDWYADKECNLKDDKEVLRAIKCCERSNSRKSGISVLFSCSFREMRWSAITGSL